MIHKAAVIIDSSVLVALLKLDDADHAKAIRLMDATIRNNGFRLLMPWEVLAESLNILGKKEGRTAAVAAGNAILERQAAGEIAFVASDASTAQSALEYQERAKGNPSFIDCLVMAYADHHDTSYVFGFDVAFQKNGYRLPGA